MWRTESKAGRGDGVQCSVFGIQWSVVDSRYSVTYGAGMEISSVLPPDYHCHTLLCKHAEGRPVEYARAARDCGLTEMACTEHNPAPEPFDPEHRMDLDEFARYREWVSEAQALDGIRVLFGIEADYYEGCEAFLGKWLPEQDFDYVLGSIHYTRYERDNGHRLTGVFDANDVEGSWARYFALVRELAATGLYDVSAHFDLPKRFGPLPKPDVMESLVKPTLDALAQADMGLEINTSGFTHDVNEQYPSLTILRWANERGIPISFGSDAHRPERMGGDFERAVQLAIEAGYTERAEYRKRVRTMRSLTATPDLAKESAE